MADSDELVTYRNVVVVRATPSALFCMVDGKAVWLPRGQAHGKLKSKGDRGTLRVRRSLALDRDLPSTGEGFDPRPPEAT